eukprot:31056-Pelagococcus_subviridis.AAC.4
MKCPHVALHGPAVRGVIRLAALPGGALVRAHRERHARVTLHAVEEVLPQTFTSAADVTERAVVHVPVLAVVPEVTHGAEIPRDDDAARVALARARLSLRTRHADHLRRRVPIDRVVLSFVVAEPAHVRGAAARGDEPRASRVVLTPHPSDFFRARNWLAQRRAAAAAAAALLLLLPERRRALRARERERGGRGVRLVPRRRRRLLRAGARPSDDAVAAGRRRTPPVFHGGGRARARALLRRAPAASVIVRLLRLRELFPPLLRADPPRREEVLHEVRFTFGGERIVAG